MFNELDRIHRMMDRAIRAQQRLTIVHAVLVLAILVATALLTLNVVVAVADRLGYDIPQWIAYQLEQR